MSFPAVVDLHKFYDELCEHESYRKARKWLKRAILRDACSADLRQAADCLESLRLLLGSPRKVGTIERAVTEGSLLNHAIMLYARATATSGSRGERGSKSISHELTPLQLEDHNALVEIRNKAIAHVYQGEKIDDTIWQTTVPLLIEFPPLFRPCFATHTIQFNRTAYGRLVTQLPVAEALMTRDFHEALNKFMAELAANPIPDALFRKHLIDPVSIFGTEARVRDVIASADKGQTSFVDG